MATQEEVTITIHIVAPDADGESEQEAHDSILEAVKGIFPSNWEITHVCEDGE